MKNKLVYPTGVRLATEEELPGPANDHARLWSLVQSANICPGYCLKITSTSKYPFYAEVNVDAPGLWKLFCDLCRGLLKDEAALLMSEIDDEPRILGIAPTDSLLDLLEPHESQLVNDGYIQFGLIDEEYDSLSEVFVVPTKHIQVWFKNLRQFRSIMMAYDLTEEDHLEFLDEYPRTTTRLPEDKVMFSQWTELIDYLSINLSGKSLDSPPL